MAELIRTRCTAGWLSFTDQAIRVERKGPGGLMAVLPRQSLTGVSYQNTVPSIFGKGGGGTLTFSGMSMTIKAEMVNHGDAQRIMEMLGFA